MKELGKKRDYKERSIGGRVVSSLLTYMTLNVLFLMKSLC